MTVVKSPVTQLQQNMISNLKKKRNERAAVWTDVTRNCKLQASFCCSNLLKYWVFVIALESIKVRTLLRKI